MKSLKRLPLRWRKLQHLLPYISAAGVIGTAICAAKAGAKSQKKIEKATTKAIMKTYYYDNEPYRMPEIVTEDIDIQEKIRLCWKDYILTTAVMGLTIASIMANKKITKREMASLAMLGTASSKLLTDYRRAVQEQYPDSYQNVVKRVASYREQDVQIADPPPITQNGFCEIMTDRPFPGDDEVLFYDELFDIWFRTSLAVVRTAQYHLNRNFILRGVVSMSEFYEFIGLDYPEEFERIGWGEEFIEGGCSWIDFSTVLSDKEDGEKFFILSYTFAPEQLEWE